METPEQRWFRWNRMIIDKKYIEVVKEFDYIFNHKKESLTIGDVVVRDQALGFIGVVSLIEEKTKKGMKTKHEFRGRKH
jgi:hypothetical protein